MCFFVFFFIAIHSYLLYDIVVLLDGPCVLVLVRALSSSCFLLVLDNTIAVRTFTAFCSSHINS